MQITITDAMLEAVKRVNDPLRDCDYDSATHDLALRVIAAIEEQTAKEPKDTPCP